MPATEKLTLVINSDSKDAVTGVRSLNVEMSKLDSTTNKADKDVQGLSKAFKVAGAAALGLAAGFTGLVAKGLKNAAALEQTAVSLEVMTGSAKQAKKTLAELEKFAQITPFQTDEVLAAGKTLLAFGESTDTVTRTLQRLGDVASLTNQRSLQEMVVMFAKMRQAGVVYAEDINQLLEAGVDVFGELAKITGKNTLELKKMASEGKLTSDLIEQVFINMTKEGGRAFNMMAKQSQTLTGLWSTTVSIFDKMASNMGAVLLPIAKQVLQVFIDNQDAIMNLGSFIGGVLVKAFQILSAIIGEVVGWFKTALNIWQETETWVKVLAGAILAVVIAFKAWAAAMVVLKAGFAAITAFVAANPIGIIVVGIGLLVIAIIKMKQNWEVVVAALELGWVRVKEAFEIGWRAIKFAVLTIISWMLWAAGKMFAPILAGVNKLIWAYNKLAKKAIPALKNIFVSGSKWAKWAAAQEQKKIKTIIKGTEERRVAEQKLYVAVSNSKKKSDDDIVNSHNKSALKMADASIKTTKKITAANKASAKKVKTEWEKAIGAVKTTFETVAGQLNTGLNLLNSIITTIFENLLAETESFYDSQIAEQEAALQAKLLSEGLAEETTIERLSRELAALRESLSASVDAEEQAALQTEIIEAEKELRRQELTEQTATEIERLEAEKAAEIARINKEQAEYQKATAIAGALISGGQAVISALTIPMPYGAIAAGIVGGLVAGQVATMIATPIPAAETGALIKGSSSGQIIRAGENNKSELIVPFENDEVMSKIGGGGGGLTINIQNLYGESDIPEKVAIAFDKAFYKLKQDGNSRALR